MLLAQFKVGTRLAAGFALLLVLLAAITAIGLSRMALLQSNLDTVVNSDFAKVALANKMRDAIRFQSIALRDIVLQEDLGFKKKELKLMKLAREDYKTAFEKLKTLITSEDTKKLLGEIHSAEERTKEVAGAALDLSLDDKHAEAAEAVREKVRPEQLKQIEQIEMLLKQLDADSKASADEADAAYQGARIMMIAMGIVAVLLGVGVAFMITVSITKPLKRACGIAKTISSGDLSSRIVVVGIDETSVLLRSLSEMNTKLAEIIRAAKSTADTVADGAAALSIETEQVLQRAVTQSERMMAISAAVEQMSVSVSTIAHGAEGVSGAADDTTHIVENNAKAMELNLQKSQNIVNTVNTSSDAITSLSNAIEKITHVTRVINGIADQTNLLALNATIEAARAGEHGRGFAVVADEVRVLSQRTASSTADIAKMINSVKQMAAESVGTMDRVKQEVLDGSNCAAATASSLTQILGAAGRVNDLAHNIVEGTRQQSAATEETANNMEQLTMLVTENNQNMQSVDATASSIARTASDLRTLVAKFKLPEEGAA